MNDDELNIVRSYFRLRFQLVAPETTVALWYEVNSEKNQNRIKKSKTQFMYNNMNISLFIYFDGSG